MYVCSFGNSCSGFQVRAGFGSFSNASNNWVANAKCIILQFESFLLRPHTSEFVLLMCMKSLLRHSSRTLGAGLSSSRPPCLPHQASLGSGQYSARFHAARGLGQRRD